MPSNPNDAHAALDELARTVLSDQSMDGLLQRIADLAKVVVPGANEVSVTFVAKDKAAATVASTGTLATALDQCQYDENAGPCLDAAHAGVINAIPDMRTETRWPGFTMKAVEAGALSSLSTPIPMKQFANAALNMYSAESGAFDEKAQQDAQSFATYAGVALANMHLYESTRTVAEQLQTAMESRAVIEQAKGVLMGQRRCTPEEAFGILTKLSQTTNRKLREVAQTMVDSTHLA